MSCRRNFTSVTSKHKTQKTTLYNCLSKGNSLILKKRKGMRKCHLGRESCTNFCSQFSNFIKLKRLRDSKIDTQQPNSSYVRHTFISMMKLRVRKSCSTFPKGASHILLRVIFELFSRFPKGCLFCSWMVCHLRCLEVEKIETHEVIMFSILIRVPIDQK